MITTPNKTVIWESPFPYQNPIRFSSRLESCFWMAMLMIGMMVTAIVVIQMMTMMVTITSIKMRFKSVNVGMPQDRKKTTYCGLVHLIRSS